MKCGNKTCICRDGSGSGCGQMFNPNNCDAFVNADDVSDTASDGSPVAGLVCEWTFDKNEGAYEHLDFVTDCGYVIDLKYTLEISGFTFCPCCGKKIKQNATSEIEERTGQ